MCEQLGVVVVVVVVGLEFDAVSVVWTAMRLTNSDSTFSHSVVSQLLSVVEYDDGVVVVVVVVVVVAVMVKQSLHHSTGYY